MMRFSLFVIILLMVNSLLAQKIIKSSAPVSDFVLDGNTIIVATTKGSVEYYNLNSKKLFRKVQFDKTIDFAGDLFDTEVFKLAKIGDLIVAVIRGENGFNDIYSIKGSEKTLLLKGDKIKSVVVDVAVSYDNMLLLGLLSNELIKFDINTKQIIYRKQISSYAFSAMCVSEKGTIVYATDESGIVHQVNTKEGELTGNFEGQNVDNVLCIDYSNGIIVCGGKDRRLSIYNNISNVNTHFDTGKFITTIAINPSAKIIVWYNTENDNLEVFDIEKRKVVSELEGHTSMVNKIMFVDDNKLISAGIDNNIIIWNLK